MLNRWFFGQNSWAEVISLLIFLLPLTKRLDPLRLCSWCTAVPAKFESVVAAYSFSFCSFFPMVKVLLRHEDITFWTFFRMVPVWIVRVPLYSMFSSWHAPYASLEISLCWTRPESENKTKVYTQKSQEFQAYTTVNLQCNARVCAAPIAFFFKCALKNLGKLFEELEYIDEGVALTDPWGSWGPGPPYPQDLFKIMQFSGNFEQILGSGPLGSKLCWAFLTKILDLTLELSMFFSFCFNLVIARKARA